MFELMAFGSLLLVGIAVLGVLCAVASLVCWVLFLPFKLLWFVFRGFALLLALPFLLVAGLMGALIFGAGVLIFFLPALPIAAIALGIWWLMRRRASPTAHAAP